jgi:hypothetical protein
MYIYSFKNEKNPHFEILKQFLKPNLMNVRIKVFGSYLTRVNKHTSEHLKYYKTMASWLMFSK